ncbi:hypothetical protein CDR68_24835 [Salmonella enterica]|nr:hypothetical protein [Salmonella enterica]
MNYFFSPDIDEILSVGILLEHLGINNWALSRNDALEVLSKFELSGIAVLGGDVFVFSDGVIDQNYDNWYCEHSPEQPNSDFITSSIKKTRHYIENYTDENALFSLVPQRN